MAASLPVIASDFELWRNIIVKENAGIVVDPKSITEISNAIECIYNNEDLGVRMGMNGRQIALNKYSWQSQYLKLLKFYQELV